MRTRLWVYAALNFAVQLQHETHKDLFHKHALFLRDRHRSFAGNRAAAAGLLPFGVENESRDCGEEGQWFML